MKKLITVCILFLSFGVLSQGPGNGSALQNTDSYAVVVNSSKEYGPSDDGTRTHVEFMKAARDNNIPIGAFSGLDGVEDGFYLVVGVYNNTKNTKRHIRKLKKKHYEARYFIHPDSGLNYVFLESHSHGIAALDATIGHKSSGFGDEIWILNVTDSDVWDVATHTNAGDHSEGKGKELMAKSEGYKLKSSGDPGTTNRKLLEKADLYFDKMWYAESAELYELALKRDSDNYSYTIIQKAGDAHYFNTNMDMACKWYDILYNSYGEEMSATTIFKYAHSLKGTGKYSRAKRMMRLYDKRMEAGEYAPAPKNTTPKEILLDNLLNTPGKYEIRNVAINSMYSEFSPMFYQDDEVVFASAMDTSFFNTRRYKWNDQPFLDLYVAKFNQESNEVRDAVKFSKKINTKYHEASVTFSPDNETMYFTRNNYAKNLKRDKKSLNNLKIYKSTKSGDEWSEAQELPFNSSEYSTGHPALSSDGKQLYFVSDMPGSLGETDIFVVDILEGGRYSEPRNLGPDINTERREMFPFISNRKFYFSSEGHVGLGGLDIYEVAFDDMEGFLEVRNLGQPINSNVDDFSYIVNEETQKGFFASNRIGGKGDDDIYSFKELIAEEVIENAIAGVVTELITGELIPEALIVLLDENNKKLKEMVTGADGRFVFEDLESASQYTLKTIKGDYFEDSRVVETNINSTVNMDISIKKLTELITIKDGIKKLQADRIFFDFDKSDIRKDLASELDKLVAAMNQYKDMVIKIESHTDSRGNNAYNKYLSGKRAESSRDYLINRGIAAERIESAIGYGEERLLNDCDGSVRCSGSQHQMNRRSEFIIVKM